MTRAAVLYTFRVMVDEPIPMNAGCLKPIEVVVRGTAERRGPAKEAAIAEELYDHTVDVILRAEALGVGEQRKAPVERDHRAGAGAFDHRTQVGLVNLEGGQP